MANNDQNEEPKQNEEPVEEQVDGLTAEEAAGSVPMMRWRYGKRVRILFFLFLESSLWAWPFPLFITIQKKKKRLKEVYAF
jgi:hypothetical protein